MPYRTIIPLLVSVCLIGVSLPALAEEGVLTLAIESDPTNIDPRFGADVNSARVYQIVCSGLVKKDPASNLIPDLAEKWENPDERTYIFYLRKGVKFHDGAEFTAEDVKYTFETILDPEMNSPKAAAYQKIEQIEIIDPYTIKFTLTEPFAPFLIEMVQHIIPKKAAETQEGKKFTTQLIGTGPFKLVEWRRDDRVMFEANDAYFGGAPKVKMLVFKILPDETTRFLELKQGVGKTRTRFDWRMSLGIAICLLLITILSVRKRQVIPPIILWVIFSGVTIALVFSPQRPKGGVDLVQNALPPDMIPLAEQTEGLKVIAHESVIIYYLGFNLEDPILKHVKVRQALAYAIDRQTIIDYLLKGQASLATGVLSPANWAYEPDVRTYKYDPEQAKTLLDEAGYPDPDGDGPQPRFEIVYKTSTDRLRIQIGEVVQEQLKQVGIEISEIQSYEWAKFFDDIKSGNFQLYTLQWVGITEPDICHSLFHSTMIPPNGRNRGRYLNPRIDELTERGRSTINVQERKAIYSEIQKILAEDLPYIFLWYPHNIVVMNARVQGFTLYPDGDFASLKDVWLKE